LRWFLDDVHITIRWNTTSWCARNCCKKHKLLVLLSVSDYKRVYTSLYFIITNFHTALKPQVKASHSMNSPAITLYTMSDQSWVIGKPFCFDQVRLKVEVAYFFKQFL